MLSTLALLTRVCTADWLVTPVTVRSVAARLLTLLESKGLEDELKLP